MAMMTEATLINNNILNSLNINIFKNVAIITTIFATNTSLTPTLVFVLPVGFNIILIPLPSGLGFAESVRIGLGQACPWGGSTQGPADNEALN